MTGAVYDLSFGESILYSPPIDLAGTHDPVLSFWLWFSKGWATQVWRRALRKGSRRRSPAAGT